MTLQEKIKNNRKIKVCPQGHDTFYFGRTKQGTCKKCTSLYHKLWESRNKDIVKSYRTERRSRKKVYDSKYHTANKQHRNILCKKYYAVNKDYFREWQKAYNQKNSDIVAKRKLVYHRKHPEVARLSSLQCKLKRKHRIPKFGQRGIVSFIKNCPSGYEIDHVIPLQGKLVSGLHVIWNLQYLTKKDNRKKFNNFDGTLKNISWKIK